MVVSVIQSQAAGIAMLYLDPSAITFLIQIIVGIVVVAGATVGIVISKLKKKAKDKLGIDLEKKKETEDEIVDYTETSEQNHTP